jgi:hypothetical protein
MNEELVREVVELRAIVSRLKQALKDIEPDVVTVIAHDRISIALADNGNLGYEIH